MPQLDFPFPRRYNSLRLLGYRLQFNLAALCDLFSRRLAAPSVCRCQIGEERSKVSPQLPDSGTHAFARLHFDA